MRRRLMWPNGRQRRSGGVVGGSPAADPTLDEGCSSGRGCSGTVGWCSRQRRRFWPRRTRAPAAQARRLGVDRSSARPCLTCSRPPSTPNLPREGQATARPRCCRNGMAGWAGAGPAWQAMHMQIRNSQSPSTNGPRADPQNAQRDTIAPLTPSRQLRQANRQQGQSAAPPTQPYWQP